MRPQRWFLPDTPDVLATLREQTETTVEGLEALFAWAGGDAGAAERLRACEHRADAQKRELRAMLTEAFTTPLEPEDIFQLSLGLDDVLNSAKNTAREAEVMQLEPDAATAEMAKELAAGTRHLADALGALAAHDRQAATIAADEAVKRQRGVEHVYRKAMSALIESNDLREIAARRELYRRLARTSDRVVDVAERVWYSVLKES
jgi:uncharacterized protein Yka (UPF0111/DUF47 family)